MRLRLWHGLLITGFFVLLVYYPALHAGYNSVDDLKMVAGIENSGPFDLQQHLFPNSKRYYYRPLNTLTYVVDRELWGLIPSFMHLENILLHLFSSLLVYFLTRRLIRCYALTDEKIPLFAALLFGLHPLATESVCWISGRTDLLSGFFMLLSVALLLIHLQYRRRWTAILAGLALILGCLAKEVAVFILPGMLWMVAVYPDPGRSWWARLRCRKTALTMPIVAIVGYFIARHAAIAHDTGINTALRGVVGGDSDILDKIRVMLKVYGFYFKKLIIPWPLNFGIVEVSDWYVLAGILLMIALLWLFLRADLLGAFGLTAFFVLSPAVLVPFGRMAWTPLAERYLYTSIALLAPILGIEAYFRLLSWKPSIQKWANYIPVILLLVFFVSTIHRAWIWQDNLRLYTDTVKKSPNFPPAKAELASALLRKGRIEESRAILTAMQSDASGSNYLVDDINLSLALMDRGELEEARNILLPHLKAKSKKYYDLLQILLRINDYRIGQTESPESRRIIQEESMRWLEEQYKLKPNPFILYRIGKMQVAMGNESAALQSFQAALQDAPADAHYRGALETFIKKLERHEI